MTGLERIVEALLFLSPEPVSEAELAEACESTEAEINRAIDALEPTLSDRGVVLRQVAGGWTLAAHPDAEAAARRLLAKPRTPPLTQAQAETLAIVAYLQPVSRPEIARIHDAAVRASLRARRARPAPRPGGLRSLARRRARAARAPAQGWRAARRMTAAARTRRSWPERRA